VTANAPAALVLTGGNIDMPVFKTILGGATPQV